MLSAGGFWYSEKVDREEGFLHASVRGEIKKILSPGNKRPPSYLGSK